MSESMRDLRLDLEELREDVVVLREQRAAQDVTQEELAKDVSKLTTAVEGLQSAIDRSRGALWAIGIMSAGLGAATGAVASAIVHKMI